MRASSLLCLLAALVGLVTADSSPVPPSGTFEEERGAFRRRTLEPLEESLQTLTADEPTATATLEAPSVPINTLSVDVQNVFAPFPAMNLKPKFFKVALVFDSTAVQAFGGRENARRRAQRIVKRMKQIFQDLPPLVLQVPEVHFWTREQEMDALKALDFKDEGFQLNAFTEWRVANVTTAHAVGHMFTARSFRNYIDTKTIFAKKSACKREIASSMSTIDGLADDDLIAKYAVHALAHTLGIDHLSVFSSQGVTMDDARACMQETGEVMQTAKWLNQLPLKAVWTRCSRIWLRMFFEGYPYGCVGAACTVQPIYNGRSDYPACMETPAPSDAFPVCGDGILQPESGEECDCGDAKTCKDKCCNASTCKLQPEAKCSANDACCDSATCSPFAATEKKVCRSASTSCDLEEVCDGSSALCPADALAVLGAGCATTEGKSGLCDASGTCHDVANQCKVLMNNPLARPCPLAKMTKPCQVSCLLPGAKSCTVTKTRVNDGAICGKKKVCLQGACVANRKVRRKRG